MKKILTLLLSAVAAVSTAFAFGGCDLFDTTDNGDNGAGTLQSGDNTSGNNNSQSGNNPSSGNNSSGGNTSGGNNTNSGNSSSSGGNTSNSGNSSSNSGNTSGGNTTHVCSYDFTSTVAPDCTNKGYDLYTCSCGKTDKRKYENALGHDYAYTYHDKTCTTDWWYEWECKRCKDYGSDVVTDSKLPHDYEWTTVKDATCTVDGSKSGVCANCGDTTTEVIKAAGHSYGDYKSNKDATCVKDGTESATCSVCGHVNTKTIVGSKTGHKYGNYQVTIAATCENDGEKSRVCATCNDVDKITVSATGHTFENGVCKNCNVAATGSSNGLIIADRGTYCEVTGLGTASGNVVIPETYNGKPVTNIGWAFNGYSIQAVRENVTGLVIPNGVTKIWPDALFGCTNLTSLTIGSGVTVLEGNAFGNCTKLKTLTIGTSITTIQAGSFYNCSSMETIIFKGTKAQWNAIAKDSGWDADFGSYTVKCTDGNITK